MAGLPQPLDRFIEECGPVTTPVRSVDHEKRPDVACLMVGADEALNPRIVLGNQENRLVQIPLDLGRRDERRIQKAIFRGSMPHLVNARQVELRGFAQARGHRDQFSRRGQA